MNNFLQMSTTGRHNKLTSSLFGEIYNLLKKQEVHALQEQCSIVYYGKKNEPTSLNLVKIDDIENIAEFKDFIIYELALFGNLVKQKIYIIGSEEKYDF